MKKTIMNRASTVVLRLALVAIGLIVLAICVFGLPGGWAGAAKEYPKDPNVVFAMRGIIVVLYAAAIPFFAALYQALKLLKYIDQNRAFSKLSVLALQRIAYSGLTISAIFAAGLPFFYIWAQKDDAPGLIVIAMGFSGAAFTVAVFATVVQRLLRQAIAIKSENDLTV